MQINIFIKKNYFEKPLDQWVVADTALPRMGKLVLYGVLELDDANGTRNFELNCTYIVILGGRLIIGWPDKPFLGQALILLEGEHSTRPYPTTSGPPVGSKAIGREAQSVIHYILLNLSLKKLVVVNKPIHIAF